MLSAIFAFLEKAFDIVIVGAGPAGCATAIDLHQSGLSVALVDKSVFPRDKICGDAISPDVVNQLDKLAIKGENDLDTLRPKLSCGSLRFVSYNSQFVDLKLSKHTQGYVCARFDFDHYMYGLAAKSEGVTIFSGHGVRSIDRREKMTHVHLQNDTTLKARMVVGADGALSVVKRNLSKEKVDKSHHAAGLRQYWQGVTGFSEDNAIELHYYKGLLPGYLWIFPLPNGRANVGLGMLSRKASAKRLNLKDMMEEAIQHHPNLKERFANARPLENVKGFGLPMGSKKRRLSGDGYLLVGDAASLINPLSGEGIANAIRSGRIAAEHLREAFKNQRFDASFQLKYDKEIYRRLWSELRLNHWVRIAMSSPWLSAFIINRGLKNRMIQQLVLSGFNVDKIKRSLLDVRLYLDLWKGK